MPGFEDDDEGTRPPPHPLDRTWLHPSELFAAARTEADSSATATSPPRNWRRDIVLTVAAGTIGAVAAVALLGVLGVFERERPRSVSPVRAAGAEDAAQVAERVVPRVAAVIATVDSTETRGSGIAVGPHEILTTTAVIGDTARTTPGAIIEICVSNGRRHRATVIGGDPVTGLVLLKVPTLTIEPLSLTAGDGLRAGDWVAAIGRTANSGTWVTSGVVTATGGWTPDPTGAVHAGMIATNTQLADEARGGALVDRDGNIVGILAVSGAATPVDMAAEVATQLEDRGWASHGSLGIRAADAAAGGATVVEVAQGSSAARAGLRVGDRIVAIDGTRTADSAALVYGLRRRPAGRRVLVRVVRGKLTRGLGATLDDAPAASVPSPSAPGTTVTSVSQPVSQPAGGSAP